MRRWLVAAILLPGLLGAGALRGHVGPVERDGPLLVEVTLRALHPYDEYEGLFRGSTGEFLIKKMRADEHRHAGEPLESGSVLHPGSHVTDRLREGVSGTRFQCVDPVAEEGGGYPYCSGPTLFEHHQCHAVRPFRVRLEIWEDDTDTETVAAVRELLKKGAGFALGTQEEIAATVISTLVDLAAVGEWLDGLDAAAREELTAVIGEDAASIATAALGVAVDRAVGEGLEDTDARLRELSEPVRNELAELAADLDASELLIEHFAGAKQAAIDWILDHLIDIVIGAGPDFVGHLDREVFLGYGPPSLAETSGIAKEIVETHDADSDAGEGAAVELWLEWYSTGQGGECEESGGVTLPGDGAEGHEVPAVPSGSRLVYPDRVSSEGFTFGSVVDSDGEPVPGVPIDSGVTVTVTDAEGRFYLPPESISDAPVSIRPHSPVADAELEAVSFDVVPGTTAPSRRWPVIENAPDFVWWSDFRIGGPGLTCSPVADREVLLAGREARLLACDGRGGWTVQALPDLPPGPVDLVASVDSRRSPPVRVQSINLQMALDPPTVRRGQRGVATLRVLGTEDPVPLRVENRAPDRVDLEGGETQVVETSGGADNVVRLRYRGRAPGDFVVNVRVARDR